MPNNNHKIATKIPEIPLFPPFKLLSVVEYPASCGEERHHAHDVFQILSVLSGEFKLWDKRGNGVAIKAGELLVIPPGWAHSWRIDEGCKAFQICFSPLLMEDYGELFLLFGDMKAEWQTVSLGKDVLEELFKRIEAEFDSCKPAATALIHSYLMELFATALRVHCGDGAADSGAKGGDRAVVKRAMDYIQKHCRERITVKKLADNSFLGESRFFQVFKKYAGCSPLNYVCRLRMEKARMLLASSHMSVSQIADYLGYESIHYFSRAYKKFHKVPPSRDRAARPRKI